jgi:hypothetical protein
MPGIGADFMVFAAKRKPEPAPDLAGDILCLRGKAEALIDGEVARIKQSRDGQGLPVELIKQQVTRGNGCLCAVAMHILAERVDA